MNIRITTSVLVALLLVQSSFSLTLEEVFAHAEGVKQMPEYRSMNDGEHYTLMNDAGTCVVKYAYATGKATDTLFNIAALRQAPIKRIEGYTLSPNESKMLVWNDVEQPQGEVFKATYYTFEISRNRMKPLSDGGKQQVPTFSPNGRMVAFVRDNNIHLAKLDYGTESPVTLDGRVHAIFNGTPDATYRNAFDMTSALAWSSDSQLLAFVKYTINNEQLYPTLYYGQSLYPRLEENKYPFPGTPYATAALFVYSVETKAVKSMNLPIDAGDYIPRIDFTTEPDQLVATTLNRAQNQLSLYTVNARSGVARVMYQDKATAWIDVQMLREITFYPQGVVIPSYRSGYRQLYLYTLSGNLVRPLTRAGSDVTAFYAYNPATGACYYQAVDATPLCRALYVTHAKGTTSLSGRKGTNQARFSSTAAYYFLQYSNAATPYQLTCHTAQGKQLRALPLNEKLSVIPAASKEFFTCSNTEGTTLHGWIVKPIPYDQSLRYPVVMLQPGVPGSQSVLDQWSYGIEQYLATEGYVVCCVDGRGTGGRGYEFMTTVYRQLGVKEREDQFSAARYLATLPYVDGFRMSAWGRGYGAFLALMSSIEGICNTTVAISPITDWRYYNALFTERYMSTPQANEEGYRASSLVEKAVKLASNLLLVSGTADRNVLIDNTWQYTRALVDAQKQFQMQLYPNVGYEMTGADRAHKYVLIHNFLSRYLSK